MSVDFDLRGQQGMDFISIIMDYGLLFWSEVKV